MNNQLNTYTYPQPTIPTSASTPGSKFGRRGGSFLDRRRQVLGAGALGGCGGRSDAPAAANSVYAAEPSAETVIFESNTTGKTTTITCWHPAGAPVQVTSALVRDGSAGGDLYVDAQGRPIMIVDATTRARTQFLHPTTTSMVLVQQDVVGAVQAVQVFWSDAGKTYTGVSTKVDPVIPADVTGIRDISSQVNSKLAELKSLQVSSTGRRLLDLLPLGSANAQATDRDLKGIALGFIAVIVAAVFPALIVAAIGLALEVAPLVVAIATVTTFVAALASIASASVDHSRAQSLVEAYISRPFSGFAQLQGSINIPAGAANNAPCTGSLSVNGTVLMSIGVGATGSASISGVEYITTPCFSQVFAKGVNSATLTRSGNTLSGQSGSPTNPFVFNFTVDPSLSRATGTVSYPYNFGSLTGFASASVTLLR